MLGAEGQHGPTGAAARAESTGDVYWRPCHENAEQTCCSHPAYTSWSHRSRDWIGLVTVYSHWLYKAVDLQRSLSCYPATFTSDRRPRTSFLHGVQSINLGRD